MVLNFNQPNRSEQELNGDVMMENILLFMAGQLVLIGLAYFGYRKNVKLQKQVRKDDLAISFYEKIIGNMDKIMHLSSDIVAGFDEHRIDEFFIGRRERSSYLGPDEVMERRLKRCIDFYITVIDFASYLKFYQTIFPSLEGKGDEFNRAIVNNQKILFKFDRDFRSKFSKQRFIEKMPSTEEEKSYIINIIKPYIESVQGILELVNDLAAQAQKEIFEPAFQVDTKKVVSKI